MKGLKSIFGLLILLVGAFVLYKILPAYWGNFKLGRLVEDQAVVYTYTPKTDGEIAADIAQKAQGFDVNFAPEQVKVQRTPGDLTITVEYSVHVDLPLYPLDLNFKAASKNHNVMAR
ncbi:MAG: hypothetical protein ABSD13_06720 [Candidatus Korobacteraceae bacterium]|jgi:hypothetical protein